MTGWESIPLSDHKPLARPTSDGVRKSPCLFGIRSGRPSQKKLASQWAVSISIPMDTSLASNGCCRPQPGPPGRLKILMNSSTYKLISRDDESQQCLFCFGNPNSRRDNDLEFVRLLQVGDDQFAIANQTGSIARSVDLHCLTEHTGASSQSS